MSDCLYCPGTSVCKHRSLEDRAQRPPTPASARVGIVAPGAAQEGVRAGSKVAVEGDRSSLFVLHGSLLDLECVLCGTLFPVGPDQRRQRYVHGLYHVRLGQARVIALSLVTPFPGSALVARFEIV